MTAIRAGRASIALATIAAACVLGTPLAAAQSGGGLVVIPIPTSGEALSYLDLHGRAGESTSAGSIELLNREDRTLRVAFAPVDAQTLSTLGSTYKQRGTPIHGATRWLGLRAGTLKLAPHTKVLLPVAVTIPRGAQPGDYLSGISIEALGQGAHSSAGGGVSTASTTRYAIGVETSLPGARHPLIHFEGASLRRDPGGLTFLLKARNSGNTILQGVNGLMLISSAGHRVASTTIGPGTFLAHTAIAYPVTAFGQHPKEGTRFDVSAWIRYRGLVSHLHTSVIFGHRAATIQSRYRRHVASEGTDLWPALALAAALAYGLLMTLLLLRRRMPRHGRESSLKTGH